MSARTFPVMYDRHDSPGPSQISWKLAEKAYSAYTARFGRGQTLERLADRGGFWANELDVFIPDWRREASQVKKLEALLRCFLVPTPMVAIAEVGPDAVMKCQCGNVFNVNACHEENLRIVTDGDHRRELVAQCPGCGLCDTRAWMGL
jgi:hypothetical protein